MSARCFIEGIVPCPWLPEVARSVGAEVTRSFGRERGPAFYLAALRYAQSLWREGRPAQAILQLNKAWTADLRGGEPELAAWPPPYRALLWILEHAPEGCFLGNPVRHFQHLATRMSGPRAESRAWRAWACFHLAGRVLPVDRFPPDGRQVAREQIEFPGPPEVVAALGRLGWPGEAELVAGLLAEAPQGGW